MRIAPIAVACLGLAPFAPRARGGGPDPTKVAAFQFLGPAPIEPGVENAVAAGAVQAIAIEPGHKNVVWIGTVNGGVWRTDDFHPGEASTAPHWTPLTDGMPSLSIGALSIDPTDDKSRTVVAAIGSSSSAASFHGPLIGILRTTDRGQHWAPLGATDLAGQDLSGVAARGATIVVTSDSSSNGGIWRSTDTGGSWTRISGTTPAGATKPLPDGPATALAADPAHRDRLWVGITGTDGGVFESENTGKTWTRVGPSSLDTFAAGARKLALDAQSYAHDTHEVYVGVIDPKPAAGSTDPDIPAIYRLTQVGSGATSADEMKDAVLPNFETLDQGKLAVAADPLHDDQFFIAGDEGLDFRCTRPVGGTHDPSCTAISDKQAHGQPCGAGTGPAPGAPVTPSHTHSATAPHADARALVFDTDFDLVATDDGGVYERTFPRMDKGDWFSKNGDLAISEAYSCAYDDHGDVALCGLQDNGLVVQPKAGETVWPQCENTDGGAVAVSDALFACPWNKKLNCSSRYYSRHSLADFVHLDCDLADKCEADPSTAAKMLKLHGAPIGCTTPSNPATCGDPDLSERTPLAADHYDAQRIAIASTTLYESSDGGATVSKVKGFTGTGNAIVFGGEHGGTKNPDLLYVASSDGLFARTAAGDVAKTTWKLTDGVPLAIAIEHDDWTSVWITTDKHTVWHGADVTGTHEAWTDVTGDLYAGGSKAHDLRAIAYVGGGAESVMVGADDGLYVMPNTNAGHWWKLTGTLPDAVVASLSYSKLDDELVIGTMGRSVWGMANASTIFDLHLGHVVYPTGHAITLPTKANANRPEGPVRVNPGDPVEH